MIVMGTMTKIAPNTTAAINPKRSVGLGISISMKLSLGCTGPIMPPLSGILKLRKRNGGRSSALAGGLSPGVFAGLGAARGKHAEAAAIGFEQNLADRVRAPLRVVGLRLETRG